MLLITCPTCAARNVPGRFECSNCFTPIAYIDPTEDEPIGQVSEVVTSNVVTSDTAPIPTPAQPELVAQAPQIHCPQCNFLQTPDASQLCLRCGALLSLSTTECTPSPIAQRVQWFVRWPWGDETLLDRELSLGRESSPDWLMQKLTAQNFDNISRRHATLIPNTHQLQLIDLGSSNGTYLNEKRLTANVAVEVPPNSNIRFATTLTVQVFRKSLV